MTLHSSAVRATLTGRMSTVESAFTTYTNVPDCAFTTAAAGTRIALRSVNSESRTFTNSPGHSRASRFSNSDLSSTVPVAPSTWLSTNVRRPSTPIESPPGGETQVFGCASS